jgi:hypothetical protein
MADPFLLKKLVQNTDTAYLEPTKPKRMDILFF